MSYSAEEKATLRLIRRAHVFQQRIRAVIATIEQTAEEYEEKAHETWIYDMWDFAKDLREVLDDLPDTISDRGRA